MIQGVHEVHVGIKEFLIANAWQGMWPNMTLLKQPLAECSKGDFRREDYFLLIEINVNINIPWVKCY